jgi:hypothetical protein
MQNSSLVSNVPFYIIPGHIQAGYETTDHAKILSYAFDRGRHPLIKKHTSLHQR